LDLVLRGFCITHQGVTLAMSKRTPSHGHCEPPEISPFSEPRSSVEVVSRLHPKQAITDCAVSDNQLPWAAPRRVISFLLSYLCVNFLAFFIFPFFSSRFRSVGLRHILRREPGRSAVSGSIQQELSDASGIRTRPRSRAIAQDPAFESFP